MGYGPGLLFFSFYQSLTPAFYALKDMRTPLKCSMICVGMNLCLNLLFVFTWADGWKHVGLAVATVLSSIANCGMLAVALRRKLGAPSFGALAPAVARLISCSLIMGAAAFAVQRWLSQLLTDAGWMYKMVELLSVGGAIAAAAGVYGALLFFFCRRELGELAEDVKGRRSRRGVK